MDSKKRIILNTAVQYSRSVLNILLSLFSTRFIIEALGNSDYGIYLLVGGVIALLGFITNALVASTQRFVSFYFGKGSMAMVKCMFANSLFVHVAVSVVLLVVMFSLRNVIVLELLNIPKGREITAVHVYNITMFLLVATVMMAPYKALFIARENIAYISIIEVCDGFVKLAVALFVLDVHYDKLLLYAFMMLVIQLLNFCALFFYALRNFEEARIGLNIKNIDYGCIRNFLGFVGWSTYGMGAVVCRSQGIQWMLNRAYNTVMNAAYGIGVQVYGSISFVATSVLNAMNPLIIKAEGEGNRRRMLYLAEKESKFSSMLLILIVVPLMVEMPNVLSFWLKEVPAYTGMFCRFILLGFIVDQATYGLNVANQAVGNIKVYTLLMYTPKLFVLVPVFFLLSNGYGSFSIMCAYFMSELFVSCARLPYIKYTCGLSVVHFLKTVVLPLLPLALTEIVIGVLCVSFLNVELRFLYTVAISIFCGSVVAWFVTFTTEERGFFVEMVKAKLK